MKDKRIGANFIHENSCTFTVWAPFSKKVEVIFKSSGKKANLEKQDKGYWEITLPVQETEPHYKFRIDNETELPDPASRSQPFGVHSWSASVNLKEFEWTDNSWKGIPISEMIIYELHIGTFTKKGTFKAAVEKLDHLLELGINTIEIMPVSQFPGNRNWGYDGVYPFAVQESYGGAKELQEFIDACHKKGIAVLLDVVYNHMGPEGNYLSQYGPYFTEKYHTPWGSAINFDDEYSDEVRNFFLQNAKMWLQDFHLDGLRLDAVHEIIDRGAFHFLKDLSLMADELEEETGRKYVLIAESDLNDTKIVSSYKKGGYGLEGQWVDDFHHALHTLITGENTGYYSDFGTVNYFAKAFKQAFVYDGIYSEFRKKSVGNSPEDLAPYNFVVCIQNHDQIGNRVLGERLSALVSFEKLKLAAGIVLISPYVPMLFMGEEFGEDQPFQYFISHQDPELVKAVQEGRKREFKYFLKSEDEFPDPQSEETFNHSKLNWNFKEDPSKKTLFEYYKFLIKLRKDKKFEAFRNSALHLQVEENKKLVEVVSEGKKSIFAAFNFNSGTEEINLPEGDGNWELIFASAAKKWNGTAAFSATYKSAEKIHFPGHSLIVCQKIKKENI